MGPGQSRSDALRPEDSGFQGPKAVYRLCLRVTEKEKEAFLIQGDLGFTWDTGPWPAASSQPPAFSSENMPLGIWGSLPENALCPKSQRFTWCKTLSKVGSKE